MRRNEGGKENKKANGNKRIGRLLCGILAVVMWGDISAEGMELGGFDIEIGVEEGETVDWQQGIPSGGESGNSGSGGEGLAGEDRNGGNMEGSNGIDESDGGGENGISGNSGESMGEGNGIGGSTPGGNAGSGNPGGESVYADDVISDGENEGNGISSQVTAPFASTTVSDAAPATQSTSAANPGTAANSASTANTVSAAKPTPTGKPTSSADSTPIGKPVSAANSTPAGKSASTAKSTVTAKPTPTGKLTPTGTPKSISVQDAAAEIPSMSAPTQKPAAQLEASSAEETISDAGKASVALLTGIKLWKKKIKCENTAVFMQIQVNSHYGIHILSLRCNGREIPWRWDETRIILEVSPEKGENEIELIASFQKKDRVQIKFL